VRNARLGSDNDTQLAPAVAEAACCWTVIGKNEVEDCFHIVMLVHSNHIWVQDPCPVVTNLAVFVLCSVLLGFRSFPPGDSTVGLGTAYYDHPPPALLNIVNTHTEESTY
jgi:hypothetical protein